MNTTIDSAVRVGPNLFHAMVSHAKQFVYGDFITLRDGYDDAECYVIRDGLAGGALLPRPFSSTVEIVSLYRLPDASRGLGSAMLRELIRRGGNYLECMGDTLATYYQNHGFKVVRVDPWDPELAPDDWDTDRLGTPSYYSLSLVPSATILNILPARYDSGLTTVLDPYGSYLVKARDLWMALPDAEPPDVDDLQTH